MLKILHYLSGLPPVQNGGMIRYAVDLLTQEAAAGWEVLLLLPGRLPKNRNKETKIRKAESKGRIRVYEIFHPQPLPMGSGILHTDEYTKPCRGKPYQVFFKQERVDVIHLHTLMGLHREFLEEAKRQGIPVVYTTHDYFGLCPLGSLFDAGSMCVDRKWEHCAQCCKNAYPLWKLRLVHTKAYRRYRRCLWLVRLVHKAAERTAFISTRITVRKPQSVVFSDYGALKAYYTDMLGLVTMFHFNSDTAKEIYQSRLGAVNGRVIPVTHNGIRDRRRKRRCTGRLRLGYFGNWSEQKGFDALLEACGQLYRKGRQDFELHLYSDTKRREECFVKNHLVFSWRGFVQALNNIDVLVVPSLWAETFGMVVLEALSCGVPCIVSRNVGAKGLLERFPKTGFVYDGTVSGLAWTLSSVYDCRELLEQANDAILKMDYDFSYTKHLRSIKELYQKLPKKRARKLTDRRQPCG